MIVLLMMAAGISYVAPEVDSDKERMRKLLQAAYAPLHDISFEYEGRLEYKTDLAKRRLNLPKDGVFISYSGYFVWRGDGATLIDSYQRVAGQSDVIRDQIAVIGSKFSEYRRTVDSRYGSGVISNTSKQTLARIGYPTNFPIFQSLLSILDDPNTFIYVKSNEIYNDHMCKIFDATFVERSDDGNSDVKFSGHRYWLDIGRGYQPVKREVFVGGQRVSRSTTTLSRYTLPTGGPFWLANHAIIEGFAESDEKRNIYYSREPQNIETFYILEKSMKLNNEMSDAIFTLKFKPGTSISDELRNLKYEFGQQKAVSKTHKESEEQLKDQLRQAEQQRDELVASSWSDSASSEWATSALWWGGILVLIISVVLLVSRRRRLR